MTRLKQLLITVLILFIFSCKKDAQIDNSSNNQSNPTVSNFSELLSLNLDEKLKNSFDSSQMKYISPNANNKLWMVALKQDALGFSSAKAAVTLQGEKLSLIVVSYEYDTTSYKKGRFETYTGIINIHNEKMVKTKSLFFQKGQLKRIIIPCQNCLLCVDCTPTHNWCMELPALCEYYDMSPSPDGANPYMYNPPAGGLENRIGWRKKNKFLNA